MKNTGRFTLANVKNVVFYWRLKSISKRGISPLAYMLYSLIQERFEWSVKNQWQNENGEIFCIFTREDMCARLQCSQPTLRKALSQLKEMALIEEERQGLNRPNLIYLCAVADQTEQADASGSECSSENIDDLHHTEDEIYESIDQNEPKDSEYMESGTVGNLSPQSSHAQKNFQTNQKNVFSPECKLFSGINKKINNLIENHINRSEDQNEIKKQEVSNKLIVSATKTNYAPDDMQIVNTPISYDYNDTVDYLKEKLDYNILIHDKEINRDELDELLHIVADTLCSSMPFFRINRENLHSDIVKSRFMKLNSSHLTYVMECLANTSAKIKNVRAYLLTSLYNAPTTICSYYRLMVNHDFAVI